MQDDFCSLRVVSFYLEQSHKDLTLIVSAGIVLLASFCWYKLDFVPVKGRFLLLRRPLEKLEVAPRIPIPPLLNLGTQAGPPEVRFFSLLVFRTCPLLSPGFTPRSVGARPPPQRVHSSPA